MAEAVGRALEKESSLVVEAGTMLVSRWPTFCVRYGLESGELCFQPLLLTCRSSRKDLPGAQVDGPAL